MLKIKKMSVKRDRSGGQILLPLHKRMRTDTVCPIERRLDVLTSPPTKRQRQRYTPLCMPHKDTFSSMEVAQLIQEHEDRIVSLLLTMWHRNPSDHSSSYIS